MSLHHRILASSYLPLRLAKSIGRPLGLSSPDRLRVLLYHDVEPHAHARFAAQLRWLARTWTFVTPERFAAMMSGAEPIIGSNLLLTFDDGFASNRVVAEQVLNPMGISGLFFVVSDFVTLEKRDEARHFIERYIEPNNHADKMPPHLYNMGWEDLEALLEQGHSIGCHTRTHARLSQITNETELEQQIIASADILGQRLTIPIEHFAYTFGDLASFSEQALRVAKRRFRFVHSGLRGFNVLGGSPLALRRDSVSPNFSTALLGSFLEGAADIYYARERSQLDLWAITEDNK